MQFDSPLIEALLIRRYKRFLADVVLTDSLIVDNDSINAIQNITTIYCPNTGSMKNCQPPNAKIWCSLSNNKKRKYALTWEIVEVPATSNQGQKAEHFYLVGINTHRANFLVEEGISTGIIAELKGYEEICKEVRYGTHSRIDFMLKNHSHQPNCYVEVKNVTLGEDDGKGLFPDAVTSRGTRHLHELMQIKRQGMRAVLFFCVQHTGIKSVTPATEIDPEYSRTLIEANDAGVEILAYNSIITPQVIKLNHPLPVYIPDNTSAT